MTAFIGGREFITLLGGVAVWPLPARAQQGERVRRIAVFMDLAGSHPGSNALRDALDHCFGT